MTIHKGMLFGISPVAEGGRKLTNDVGRSPESFVHYFTDMFHTISPNKILPEPEPEPSQNHELTTYIRCLFHDLRGPLNNICLGIDVVMSSIPQDSDNHELLTSVRTSCTFLNDSLDGFLNIKSLNNNIDDAIVITHEPFNVVGLMNKAQHILRFNALQKNIVFSFSVKKMKEWVIGDTKHIQHVIMNLLSNAIKFAAHNSNIYLSLECINIVNGQQHILITIGDDNPFIAKTIKDRLFQRYNTSDSSNGTGLGLYICKHIIELHNGHIQHRQICY